MKEFLTKYWKFVLGGIAIILISFILYQGGAYIYRNSYSTVKYEYAEKAHNGQGLDKNVTILKKIRRNNKDGEFTFNFDKKELNEVYEFTLGSEIKPSFVEVGVVGKINAGTMNIRLQNLNNEVLYDRTVEGLNIKEISTTTTNSRTFKLFINSYGAHNGDVKIHFNFK